METIGGVDTFAWNPHTRLGSGAILSRIPTTKRICNFGDLIGPILVRRLLAPRNPRRKLFRNANRRARLISVGSVLHFSKPGDVVWGSGINGKIKPNDNQLKFLDVRSVRGPLTASYFRERGINIPEVFGDPGLLLPHLFPVINQWEKCKNRDILAVPNLNDLDSWKAQSDVDILDPRSNFWDCIRKIAESRVIIASSLHALIIADALGIPSIPVKSQNEPDFKYMDYYLGAELAVPSFAPNLGFALGMSPCRSKLPVKAPHLLEVFPWDLWNN